jgi:undecaprenyl-diphosphatase
MIHTRPSPDRERTGRTPPDHVVLTRSPIYLFTLVAGTLVAGLGWLLATTFEQSLIATADDLGVVLPDPVETFIPSLLTVVTVVAVVFTHLWLLYARQFRRLGLAYAAFTVGMVLAFAAGHVLLAVARPETRALFEAAPSSAARTLPSDPAVAGVVAVLVLVRKWVPLRGRRVLYGAVPLLLLCGLGAPPPPHLAVVLDVGIGMIAGSLVPLALRTPTPRPGRTALIDGLAANGVDLVELRSANVDARGSEPWFGTTADGGAVFVKALSSEQRVADLMFRAARWLRLRRTGDAPPEISLQRAAEHEAFLSHHVRSLGMSSPRLLTVVDLGDDNVALAYERIAGRSLDRVDPAEVTDRLLQALWRQVATLRSHGIAHRDLRLANVFLTDDGDPVLIDFGFGELSASQQLLDTDVAELLAATSTAVGVDRAVTAAVAALGPDTVAAAREWLLPGTLTSATRRAVHERACLQALREATDGVGGHGPTTTTARPVPAPRLAAVAIVTLGLYTAVGLTLGDDLPGRLADVDWLRASVAVVVGLLVHPARGLAFRSASRRRAPFPLSAMTSMATHLPAARRTYWRWAGHLYVVAGHTAGLTAASASRAVALWVGSGLAVAPILVTGVVASGLEADHGYAKGVGVGLLCGAGLLLVQLIALRAAPISWDLTDMWAPSPGHRQHLLGSAVGSTVWWFVARGVESLAFVLIAQSAGPVAATESLVAIWVCASAIAWLWPGPAHLWLTELLVFVALVAAGADPGSAAFAAVAGRIVTFWVQVPLARWAYRALMDRTVDDGGVP